MADSPQVPIVPPAGKGGEAPPAGEDGCNLPIHPLVAALLKDDDPPLDMILLAGYIGKSEKEGYYRLYLDLSFGSYFEVPCREVRHSEAMKDGDANSPTLLYLSATTKVELVQITSSNVADFFLQGSIASTYLPTSAPCGGGVYPTQTAAGVTTTWAAEVPACVAGHPTSTCLPNCHPGFFGNTCGNDKARPTETCHTVCQCAPAYQVHTEVLPTETCHTSFNCPHPPAAPIGYQGIQNNLNYLYTGHPSVCTCRPICH